uniref:Uncharacterized protein n=1 Tax=Setaria italica TaxID=4555 RepID=K4A2X8_SETIT
METEAPIVDADPKDVPPVTCADRYCEIEGGSHTPDQTTERGRRKLESEETAQRILIRISLLLAAATAVVLWRSRGQPPLVAWRLSFALCLGSCTWAAFFLTETAGRALTFAARVLTFAARVSHGLALAWCADAALGPAIGVLSAHLATHLAAGLLGYALAERRQREGTELSAATVLVAAADDEEEASRQRLLGIVAWTILSVPAAGVPAGVAWIVWHSAGYRVEELVLHMLILLPIASIYGILAVDMMRLGGNLLLAFYFTVVFILRLFLSEALGDVAAMVITALFGYCLCVYATFKRIM